jgi:hypothetical protein
MWIKYYHQENGSEKILFSALLLFFSKSPHFITDAKTTQIRTSSLETSPDMREYDTVHSRFGECFPRVK